MTDNLDLSASQLIRLLWAKLMMLRRFDAAASVAALSLMLSRQSGSENHEFREDGLHLGRKALDELAGEGDPNLPVDDSKCCSFCGKSPPEVRLVQGPKAAICNECVNSISEVFERDSSE